MSILNIPNALFFVGTMALYNFVQNFIPSMSVTKRIYANRPDQVTDLTARLMGVWTLTSAIVRIYASYHIHDRAAYDLCLATFAIALFSFSSEIFVYKTAPITSPGVFPAMLISTTMLVWMLSSYGVYVQ
ncbi:ergosterol biosynthesis protein [Boothiomyces macroporosus]|uniref:Ergosterol biosynthesis protein n=1 Tax=Boothiomyces macroporosus TaxID=261099 RepID=A0AAD5Y736_9FUNG|nr:ergosterol biosynthesis protein [Boothiomyces macroporosus]KAJ3315987.1 ergosterol biosynthesis protein [Boothiomyces sp. JEL0838]